MGEEFTLRPEVDLRLPTDKIFRAKLMEVKRVEQEWTDYKDKDAPGQAIKKTFSKMVWWWEIQDENYRVPDTGQLRRVRGECKPEFGKSDSNDFYRWVKALLGGDDIPLDTTISIPDDIVGLSADILIRHDKDKNNPKKIYEQVDEVMPIEGGLSSSEAPPF